MSRRKKKKSRQKQGHAAAAAGDASQTYDSAREMLRQGKYLTASRMLSDLLSAHSKQGLKPPPGVSACFGVAQAGLLESLKPGGPEWSGQTERYAKARPDDPFLVPFLEAMHAFRAGRGFNPSVVAVKQPAAMLALKILSSPPESLDPESLGKEAAAILSADRSLHPVFSDLVLAYAEHRKNGPSKRTERPPRPSGFAAADEVLSFLSGAKPRKSADSAMDWMDTPGAVLRLAAAQAVSSLDPKKIFALAEKAAKSTFPERFIEDLGWSVLAEQFESRDLKTASKSISALDDLRITAANAPVFLHGAIGCMNRAIRRGDFIRAKAAGESAWEIANEILPDDGESPLQDLLSDTLDNLDIALADQGGPRDIADPLETLDSRIENAPGDSGLLRDAISYAAALQDEAGRGGERPHGKHRADYFLRKWKADAGEGSDDDIEEAAVADLFTGGDHEAFRKANSIKDPVRRLSLLSEFHFNRADFDAMKRTLKELAATPDSRNSYLGLCSKFLDRLAYSAKAAIPAHEISWIAATAGETAGECGPGPLVEFLHSLSSLRVKDAIDLAFKALGPELVRLAVPGQEGAFDPATLACAVLAGADGAVTAILRDLRNRMAAEPSSKARAALIWETLAALARARDLKPDKSAELERWSNGFAAGFEKLTAADVWDAMLPTVCSPGELAILADRIDGMLSKWWGEPAAAVAAASAWQAKGEQNRSENRVRMAEAWLKRKPHRGAAISLKMLEVGALVYGGGDTKNVAPEDIEKLAMLLEDFNNG